MKCDFKLMPARIVSACSFSCSVFDFVFL